MVPLMEPSMPIDSIRFQWRSRRRQSHVIVIGCVRRCAVHIFPSLIYANEIFRARTTQNAITTSATQRHCFNIHNFFSLPFFPSLSLFPPLLPISVYYIVRLGAMRSCSCSCTNANNPSILSEEKYLRFSLLLRRTRMCVRAATATVCMVWRFRVSARNFVGDARNEI